MLDEDALDAMLQQDPDEALALLADLVGATDRELAARARRLAARIMVALARSGTPRAGIGRLRIRPLAAAPAGDIDLDSSLEALGAVPERRGDSHGARRVGIAEPGGLRVSAWTRHDTAVCLVVDRSGSMAGERLATAAVGAAAVLHRVPRDSSVVCFSDRAVVVRSQDSQRPVQDVLGDVFALRGFGVTDLGLALRAAAGQLARSRASRRVAILLSDCRATAGGDPLAHVAGIDELVVLAPAEDTADAEAFALASGARWAPVEGPSAIPEALAAVLGS